MPLRWICIKTLTENDSCHGRGESELLLKVFRSERNKSVDEDGIKRAVEHREHERTVSDERLACLHESVETFGSKVQCRLVVQAHRLA